MEKEFNKGTRNYNSNEPIESSMGMSIRGYPKTIGQDGTIGNNLGQENMDSLMIEENSFHVSNNPTSGLDDIKQNSRQNTA
jgi:hypothetical protein